MKRRFIVFATFLVCNQAFAWQPCMPFCDAGCGGAALQTMGASISSALQSQASTNQQLLQALNDTTQSTVSLGTDLVDVWTSDTMDLLSALDARTAKIELANTAKIKALEISTDTTNKVFAQTLREKYIAEKISENNRDFSNTAMPETGEVLSNLAGELKEAYIKSDQLSVEISDIQNEYAKELTAADTTYATNQKLTAPDDIYRSHIVHCEKTYSAADLTNLQKLLTYLTNPQPLPVLPDKELSSPKALEYELSRRVHNAKLGMVSAVINQVISHKAQFADPNFVRSYVSRSANEPEMSVSETMDSLVNGRITSDGWFLNMKITSKTGLNRELTYLKAEENALLFLLSQRREWRNQMLAILATQELNSKSSEIRLNGT